MKTNGIKIKDNKCILRLAELRCVRFKSISSFFRQEIITKTFISDFGKDKINRS